MELFKLKAFRYTSAIAELGENVSNNARWEYHHLLYCCVRFVIRKLSLEVAPTCTLETFVHL